MKNTFSKGFTLVELLIVITILAALAAAVVVVLNPAELLAQARDAQRMADMTVTRDALLLLISQVPATDFCAITATGCTTGHCTFAPTTAMQPFAPATCTVPSAANLRTTAGLGWVTANFAGMPGGAPIAILPIDPVNNATFFYAFRADAARTFRLATRLESVRHRAMMQNDGGPDSSCGAGTTWTTADCYYEVGTNMVVGF